MVDLIQIVDVCSEPNILKVILFIKTLLNYLFILVPIGLIVMISIDFGKNVIAQNQEDMKKNFGIAIKRLIYCVALFLIPTIVNTAFSLLGELDIDYVRCINNAETEKIESIILSNAKKLVEKLEQDPTRINLIEAENAILQLSDDSIKLNYEERVSKIREEIKEREAQEKAEKEQDKESEVIIVAPQGPSSDDKTSIGKGLWVAHQKNDADRVDAAIKEGFWGIEVDVYQSGNVFQLYHDSENDPYSGYDLDVFLDTCKKNNITAVLDLKSINNYSSLVSLVKDKGMEKNTIYQTGTWAAKEINSVDNNARIWILISDKYEDVNSEVKDNLTSVKDYIEGVNMLALNVNESDIKAIHDLGLTICSFSYISTLYENASAETLREWGSNYLMANNIDE